MDLENSADSLYVNGICLELKTYKSLWPLRIAFRGHGGEIFVLLCKKRKTLIGIKKLCVQTAHGNKLCKPRKMEIAFFHTYDVLRVEITPLLSRSFIDGSFIDWDLCFLF